MHSTIEKYVLNIIILLERYKSIICINKILTKRQIKHAQKIERKENTIYHMHLYLKYAIICKVQLCIEKIESKLYFFYFKFKIKFIDMQNN